jgi:hypothetical protein
MPNNATGRIFWKRRMTSPFGYIDSPTAGEGGTKTRVPTLYTKDRNGVEFTARSNEDKARIIADSFSPPLTTSVPANFRYHKPVAYKAKFTREQIARVVSKLSPYKTPGPDGIPNIVFKQCIDIIIDHLYHIYNSSLRNGHYFPSWLESLTAVIRKPGRQAYDVPKAYRPIALLNAIAKIFTALVAKDVSNTNCSQPVTSKTDRDIVPRTPCSS